MTRKRKTRVELEAALVDLQSHYGALRIERDAAVQGGKELRVALDDVKERLARAEADNQRMRGYIDRVQEDDVAREELVTVGDPAGEQQLVPKRKPKLFTEPNPYLQLGARNSYEEMQIHGCNAREQRKPPRHWVSY